MCWRPVLRIQQPEARTARLLAPPACFPFVLIYWPGLRYTGWDGLLTEYIPEMKSFLLMADGNYVWKAVTTSLLAHASTPDWGRRIGIGLVPSAAWIAASIFSIWQLTK